jgi:hypothetical protein
MWRDGTTRVIARDAATPLDDQNLGWDIIPRSSTFRSGR